MVQSEEWIGWEQDRRQEDQIGAWDSKKGGGISSLDSGLSSENREKRMDKK